jgi:hypothetical protein
MVDMCAEKVDPAGRADYKDAAVRRVSLGKRLKSAHAHPGRFELQIVIISIYLVQLFVKGAVCISNQLNPTADGLQATDFKRHKFSSSNLLPGCLQVRGMIGDLLRAGQEKSPAIVGGYLNCVFDKNAEIPYKMFLENG